MDLRSPVGHPLSVAPRGPAPIHAPAPRPALPAALTSSAGRPRPPGTAGRAGRRWRWPGRWTGRCRPRGRRPRRSPMARWPGWSPGPRCRRAATGWRTAGRVVVVGDLTVVTSVRPPAPAGAVSSWSWSVVVVVVGAPWPWRRVVVGTVTGGAVAVVVVGPHVATGSLVVVTADAGAAGPAASVQGGDRAPGRARRCAAGGVARRRRARRPTRPVVLQQQERHDEHGSAEEQRDAVPARSDAIGPQDSTLLLGHASLPRQSRARPSRGTDAPRGEDGQSDAPPSRPPACVRPRTETPSAKRPLRGAARPAVTAKNRTAACGRRTNPVATPVVAHQVRLRPNSLPGVGRGVRRHLARCQPL